MNLKTLKYYIAQEKHQIQRIFISLTDWDKLLKQVGEGEVEIHINNWFDLGDISIHRNMHLKLNHAQFIILNGDPKLVESYFDYTIEILTPEEKIIRDIIE